MQLIDCTTTVTLPIITIILVTALILGVYIVGRN